ERRAERGSRAQAELAARRDGARAAAALEVRGARVAVLRAERRLSTGRTVAELRAAIAVGRAGVAVGLARVVERGALAAGARAAPTPAVLAARAAVGGALVRRAHAADAAHRAAIGVGRTRLACLRARRRVHRAAAVGVTHAGAARGARRARRA